ncbi:ABC transporter ATP-binding protein [Shewanella schlegeliana]|uniref:ABC transporter ATP-binding protein n=1 Tax=Shewanella schlegeliana TaxID=190308 RepID=A0ABS1SYA9_9GAMM|nr:ABC transporter ATP-binding protein [Shewanella schlegeliana]MBL4912542.1 ABC transporter ATP-binding protein [Shewanella schlegeliana]MCL1107988.1 ABC transporter ATP-binding protein [Shewanella schlegeliana]GIU21306.1 ABC transporter [Shewanella schlegeliana]
MASEIVRLSRVSKGFNDGDKYHQVLDDISLRLDTADTIALTGPSGCGKSTLLNIIAGFEFIKQGQLFINSQSTSNWQDKQWSLFRRQHLGMVFQQFNLLTPLNVKDNIAFSLRLNQQKWSPWCDYLIEQLGLAEVKNRSVETLSGGQQQRVAIARALAHKPRLLLADEPTGNLDEKSGQQVMTLLSLLAKESNTAILMVTHSSDCADFMKRRWHLEHGKILE